MNVLKLNGLMVAIWFGIGTCAVGDGAMSYDQRLSLKCRFKIGDATRVNNFKMVDYEEFVQVYINNGDHHCGFRLSKEDRLKLMEYLKGL